MSMGISKTSEIAGFIGACLVDTDTGLMLSSEGGGNTDLETAAALAAQLVQTQLTVMSGLDLDDRIEDILITLGKQYHMIRLLANGSGLFIYIILDKRIANLGMARLLLKNIEAGLSK